MLDRVPSSRRAGVARLAVLALLSLFIQPAGVDAEVAVRAKPATFHNATWYLRSNRTSGVATSSFRYGRPGDIPVMGDWDVAVPEHEQLRCCQWSVPFGSDAQTIDLPIETIARLGWK